MIYGFKIAATTIAAITMSVLIIMLTKLNTKSSQDVVIWLAAVYLLMIVAVWI